MINMPLSYVTTNLRIHCLPQHSLFNIIPSICSRKEDAGDLSRGNGENITYRIVETKYKDYLV